jgi:hypothetical protein
MDDQTKLQSTSLSTLLRPQLPCNCLSCHDVQARTGLTAWPMDVLRREAGLKRNKTRHGQFSASTLDTYTETKSRTHIVL